MPFNVPSVCTFQSEDVKTAGTLLSLSIFLTCHRFLLFFSPIDFLILREVQYLT